MQPLGTNPADFSRELKPSARDRRRCARQKVHTPAYASVNGNSSGMVLDLSEILDISEEGMSIQNSSPLDINRALNLCLDLSESKTYIHTTGQVIWSNPSGRVGIRLPGMQQASLRQLKEWLFVNALAGCVNHLVQQREHEPQEQKSREVTPEADTARKQGFEPSGPPDYTTVLTALGAVRREVEALGTNLDSALRLVAERAQALTHATGAAIALSQGKEMICVASSGADSPALGTRLQVGSGFSGECVGQGRVLRCDDSETDPRVDRESCRALGIRSMVAVPIRLGDAVVGLLEMFSGTPNAFAATDQTVLQRLAEVILAAVSCATRVSTVKSRPVEARGQTVGDHTVPGTEVVVATPVELAPSRFPRILLIIATAVLVTVLVWTIAPEIRSRIGGSRPPGLQVKVANTQAASVTEANGLSDLRSLAEHGDPAAQFALGARFATGEEVKQDYVEAARWFTRAAEQGHIAAQATLGAYYWAGRGVRQDLSSAYFWSILAQTGGDEASKYRVAVLASRMTRNQVLAAQEKAGDWLKQHQLAGSSTLPAQ
jgi:putative methionine-R-sulfoxide reductase with GAF domain